MIMLAQFSQDSPYLNPPFLSVFSSSKHPLFFGMLDQRVGGDLQQKARRRLCSRKWHQRLLLPSKTEDQFWEFRKFQRKTQTNWTIKDVVLKRTHKTYMILNNHEYYIMIVHTEINMFPLWCLQEFYDVGWPREIIPLYIARSLEIARHLVLYAPSSWVDMEMERQTQQFSLNKIIFEVNILQNMGHFESTGKDIYIHIYVNIM